MQEDYKFGDPKTNGKGHQLIKWKGGVAVKMPGPKVWKVKRHREKAATVKQILNDGTESFVANQIAQEHAELEAQLFGDSAMGEEVGLDELFNLGARRAAEAAQSSAQPGAEPSSEPKVADQVASKGAKQDTEEKEDEFTGFGFACLKPTDEKALEAPANDAAVTPTKPTRRRGGKGSAKKAQASPVHTNNGKDKDKDKGKDIKVTTASTGRGRPKQDPKKTTEELVKNVCFTDSDDVLWTNNQPHLRFLDRLRKSVKALADEATADTELAVLSKQVHTLFLLGQAYGKYGGYSHNLASAMKEVSHYLSMTPPAELDLPPFLKVQVHEMKIASAPPADFWKLLDERRLIEEGYEESELKKTQVALIIQRLGNITAQDVEVVRLAQNGLLFFHGKDLGITIDPTIQLQLKHLSVICGAIAGRADLSIETLRSAVESSAQKDEITTSLQDTAGG